MSHIRKFQLIETAWPEFGVAVPPLPPTVAEFETRLAAVRSAMERHGLTHLVVYGDREHFANLAYLSGFDPRFEEALLIIAQDGAPLLLVGNECAGYLTISPLYVAGQLRTECFQPFSLLNQPREQSRLLRAIFIDEGIRAGATVGTVGWKYFADSEHPDSTHALDLPSYLADTLRHLVGWENVTNATALLMHPDYGLRTFCTPAEIAYFEYTNTLAAEGMKRVLFGLRPGMTDYELAQLYSYNGAPQSCYLIVAVGENTQRGLTSPTGLTIRRGDPLATNIAYWGSNSCRAGWVAASAADLPTAAQDYVDNFAGPYFAVLAEWFRQLRIGTPGGALAQLVAEQLPYDQYGIFLNPGHLIHLDEWVSSPIYPGSKIPLHSGMALQVDVIPSSPRYFSTRMEDGVVLADAPLRQALEQQYPACYARCQQRREFMINTLGFELAEEVLPLSNIPGIVPPYFLTPNLIFALKP